MLELTLINDDKNTHCAVLPSNGDTQFLWLVNHSKGTATLEQAEAVLGGALQHRLLYLLVDEVAFEHADDLLVGDQILFGKYAGQEIKLDGQEYLIMKEDDVLAVIEGHTKKKLAAIKGKTKKKKK